MRTHHKVAQPPFCLQADGDSEPPKAMNPNALSERCVFVGGRAYPAPTIATLKSGLGSKAMVFLMGGSSALKSASGRPPNVYCAGVMPRCSQVPGLVWL
jgi:hypothetical protein